MNTNHASLFDTGCHKYSSRIGLLSKPQDFPFHINLLNILFLLQIMGQSDVFMDGFDGAPVMHIYTF